METNFEKEIINIAKKSIAESIAKNLEGYSSPLTLLIKEVVSSRESELKSIVNELLGEVLVDEEFKKILKEEFKRRVAKQLVGDLTGAIEKSTNSFKQDPTLKAKMILSLETIMLENTQQ